MPVVRRSRELDVRASARRGSNARISRRERESKLATRMLSAQTRAPLMVPVTLVYHWLAWVLMVPLCFVTLLALFSSLNERLEGGLWKSPPFWFFSLGFLLWLIWFLFCARPVRLYVWGHEMTHALCTILCFGGVREFHVTPQGGHVITTKNNLLISLSPYFVPLFSLVAVLVFLSAGLYVDLNAALRLPWGGSVTLWYGFYCLIGLTWSFHITFTVWMIGKDQPDLRINGVFFSLCVIVFVNLLVLAGLLLLASPGMEPADFGRVWLRSARTCAEALSELFRVLGQLLRG